MGLLDTLFAAPGSAQGLQNAGLFGGLQALGAGLAAAGQMRPVGQPGPGLADAFLGYQRGAQAGLLGAYQQSEMDRRMKRTGLLAEAQSDKPDDQISPEARQLRPILSSLPPEVRAFAGPDELPGLAIQRGTQRQRPMTAEELAAGGFRPGSVVMVNDFTGNPNVVQQPDTMTPEALQQKIAIQRAGLQPQVQWRTITDAQGNVIAKMGSNGDYVPLRADPAPVSVAPGGRLVDPRTGRIVAEGGPDKPNLPAGYQMVDGKAVPIPGLAEAQQQQAASDPQTQAKGANELRDEYTKLTGDFRTVQDAFAKIQMAGKTGQGDMALLYGYMKILDPGSVVRESEFATAARSGSLPQQIQGWATRVINGERLPDAVREGFKAEAQNVYQAQTKGYENLQKQYRDLALRRGVKPEDVVIPFQYQPGGAAGGGGGGASRGSDPMGLLK